MNRRLHATPTVFIIIIFSKNKNAAAVPTTTHNNVYILFIIIGIRVYRGEYTRQVYSVGTHTYRLRDKNVFYWSQHWWAEYFD